MQPKSSSTHSQHREAEHYTKLISHIVLNTHFNAVNLSMSTHLASNPLFSLQISAYSSYFRHCCLPRNSAGSRFKAICGISKNADS